MKVSGAPEASERRRRTEANKMTEKLETVLNREKVDEVLDRVRPALMADGGNVELVDVKDGVVSVRLTGACGSCPMSTMTLRAGVERVLRQEFPEMKQLVAV
jgi:Fe-S cluster biogenesis protein NfuA